MLKTKRHFLTYYIRQALPRYQSQSKNTPEKKQNYKTLHLIVKHSFKNYQETNATHIKIIICHDQVRLIPEMQVWLNIRKSINVIYLINRINEKSHKAISIHVKKHFISQNLTPFHDRKTLRKIGIKGKFLIMLKDIYEKLSANIRLMVKT